MPKSKLPVVIMALIVTAIGASVPLCLSSLVADRGSGTPPTPTVEPTRVSLAEISVLLVGVDSLAAPQPHLESLAIVKYQTEINSFFVMMVSPETVVGEAGSAAPAKTIRSYYAEDARLQRQALITHAALRKISEQFGNIYVDVNYDRQAISETLGLLGQFDCLGQPQTSEALLRQVDALPPEAIDQRLRLQGDILVCLFEAARQQKWDFPRLMENLGRRFYPTRDHAANAFGAAPPLALSVFTVSCAPLNPLGLTTPQP